MTLDEAIMHIKRGNAVLFTGAGFSYQTHNSVMPPNNSVPDAKRFARQLALSLGSSEEYPLPTVSQAYIKKKGAHELVRELLASFIIIAVQSYHKYLASLPWKRVYTTNYDNCFEFSALQTGLNWTPLTTDAAITAQKNLCVHINGYVANLTTLSLETQVKLTHTSYSADSFANSRWSQQFRQDINAAKVLIFVGYSMADLDISRILFSSPELIERTLFIVAPCDDDIIISPLEAFGSVYRIGIEAFADEVTKVQVSEDKIPYEYTWLVRYKNATRIGPPDDASTIDLITKGIVDRSCLDWALAQPGVSYCVRRDDVDTVVSQIGRGKRWFLVHSDLGDGKSIFKEQLSDILSKLDFEVFWDCDFEQHRKSDLSALAKETKRVALFLDGTSERFDAIDGLLQLNNRNIFVFICVRSTLYELGESKYDEYLPDDYVAININRLSSDEVARFVDLFNKYGLWGRVLTF
ncbi:MAG: SIR2 family protein [Anaerolineaceae bacterium]|nr:SIR2 family protein [Anaerolineaceae bacterium]